MGRAGLHPSAAARGVGSRPEIKSSILFLASDVDVDTNNDDDDGNDGVDDDGC